MKRICMIALVVICLLIAVGMILPVSAESSYVRGDADGDGTVTILDATVIQRHLASLPTSSFNESAADVDGDGVNIIDATIIQRYLAGFENICHIDEAVFEYEPTEPEPTHDPYELPVVYSE